MKACWFGFFLIFLAPLRAQLPSELLLIVNGSSPAALTVSNHYIALRGIPAERVLVLEPPESFFREDNGGTRWRTSKEQVRRHLLDPVTAKLTALQDPFPTALVFSPDWPIHLRLDDGVPASVTAFVATRGNLPPAEAIKTGQARSPWFTAPQERQQGRRLHRFPANELKEAGMHPAMMLGVFYEPLTPDSIVISLQRAARADFSSPQGSVAIITNTDVRSTTRLPQFGPAAARLEEKGIPVHLAARGEGRMPNRLIGVMEGAATVPIDDYRGKLLPGSFAEHLTSFAGTFHNNSQTKMTRWIAAGAAGTIGTVDEPFAIWTKFPMAEIFERYALGNTLLESLMQSVGSPFQTLAIGDPLCRPWGSALPDLNLETAWADNTLTVRATGVQAGASTDLHLFVDGRRVAGAGPEWVLALDAEQAGPSLDLLLHARRSWAPPEVGRVRKTVDTPFPARLRLTAPRRQPRDALRLTIETDENIMMVELWQGNRRLIQDHPESPSISLDLPKDRTGSGPVSFRAHAILESGRMVWSDRLDRDLR